MEPKHSLKKTSVTSRRAPEEILPENWNQNGQKMSQHCRPSHELLKTRMKRGLCTCRPKYSRRNSLVNSSKLSKFVRLNREFGYSTMPQIFNVTSMVMRVFWVVAYVVFVCVCIQQAYSTLHEYLSYPVNLVISIDTQADQLEFPAVTVCNNNIVRKNSIVKMTYLQDLFHLDDYVMRKVEQDTG